MKPGKIVSLRDTEVQPAGEIGRRLAGLAYLLAAAFGSTLTIAGLVRHQHRWLLVGGACLVLWLLLHLTRRRWRLGDLAGEVGQNPFKPERAAPVDPEDSKD